MLVPHGPQAAQIRHCNQLRLRHPADARQRLIHVTSNCHLLGGLLGGEAAPALGVSPLLVLVLLRWSLLQHARLLSQLAELVF